MFSVSIHHRFESSFVSFISVLYHFSSFLHTKSLLEDTSQRLLRTLTTPSQV